MPTSRGASSPFIWPPVIYLTAVVAASVSAWFAGWHYQPPALRLAGIAVGCVLIALGVGAGIAAERIFKGAGTPVPPTQPTTAIVTTGVYGYTRNPMYLGMTLALAGFGFAFDQLWFLIVLPVAVIAVTKLAIEREEIYLERKFGSTYLDYKVRVRRWL